MMFPHAHTRLVLFFYVLCSAQLWICYKSLELQTYRVHPTTAGLQEPFLSSWMDQGLVKMEAYILDRESKSYSDVFLSNWPTLNISCTLMNHATGAAAGQTSSCRYYKAHPPYATRNSVPSKTLSSEQSDFSTLVLN